MAKKKVIQEEKVAERWSYLLQGADGKREDLYKKIEKNLSEVEPPDVEIKREMVAPEWNFSNLLKSKKREFLIATNKKIKGGKLFIGARDYGKQLAVSWYLVREPGQIEALMEKISSNIITLILLFPIYGFLVVLRSFFDHGYGDLYSPVDLFDIEELISYVTTVHHAVLDGVSDIMRDLKQDPSLLDRRSRGFLEIT